MLSFFRKKPLLREESIQWMIATYAWAMENFGIDIFYVDTFLVTPTDKYFPDKVEVYP